MVVATNNRMIGDLTRKNNIIETFVYSAQHLRNYDEPTLEVNADLRDSDYQPGTTGVGSAIMRDGGTFNVVFKHNEEFDDPEYGTIRSAMESNQEAHLGYSGDRVYVKALPEEYTETGFLIADELEQNLDGSDRLEEPDLDGSVNINDNDSFNVLR